MAVDHLLFDNKVFLAMPTEITVPDGFEVNSDTSMYDYNYVFYLQDDHTANVVAVGEKDYIIHPQQSWYSSVGIEYIAWLKVPKDQAKNVKWGASISIS